MTNQTKSLRSLIKRKKFITMPSGYDALTARMIETAGFDVAYAGGFVTGGATCISEPMLTMTEQLQVAGDMANAVKIPVVVDGGAGWGEPLHTMRTVRETIRAGVAGIHIEDQLFPKRAHYHTYVAHNIPIKEYRDKIRLACEQRDALDKDFVIIARSDACRIQGYKEAIKRVNLAAEHGADMSLIFPRTDKEAASAPRDSDIPTIYVISRGNRDKRPIYTYAQLADMGYAGVIDATLSICVNFHYTKIMLAEIKSTGAFSGMTEKDFVAARQGIEDMIGLDDYYRIESATVEKLDRPKKAKR
jgi:2-methylisocitrate lyase-like PEP mutase family enzyme